MQVLKSRQFIVQRFLFSSKNNQPVRRQQYSQGRFHFSKNKLDEIDYSKLSVLFLGATFFMSITGVTYFYFNMDQIASKRIDNFEKQSGIAYDDFKVDKPLDDEYRMEYIEKQKRKYRQKIEENQQIKNKHD